MSMFPKILTSSLKSLSTLLHRIIQTKQTDQWWSSLLVKFDEAFHNSAVFRSSKALFLFSKPQKNLIQKSKRPKFLNSDFQSLWRNTHESKQDCTHYTSQVSVIPVLISVFIKCTATGFIAAVVTTWFTRGPRACQQKSYDVLKAV